MRYRALKAEGVAIGSGVFESASEDPEATQRKKRSGMRWRIRLAGRL